MEFLSNFDILGSLVGLIGGSVPVVFIAIVLIKKFFPQADPYFAAAKPVIAEIDDRLDELLLEWDNNALATVNDIIGQINDDLERAGYKLDDKEKEKVASHTKAQIKRKSESPEGLSLSRDDKNDFKINFKKDF